MATTRIAKIDFYGKYATDHLYVDEDDKGLFCLVVSERHENVKYTVRVDECNIAPIATSCNCPAVEPCKHISIVNAFYARIYKSNLEKFNASQAAEIVEETDDTEPFPPFPEENEAVEEAKVEKPVYRIISTGAKRDRFDLVGHLTEKREHKAAMLGEISEIKARASADIGHRGSFGSKAFSILR